MYSNFEMMKHMAHDRDQKRLAEAEVSRLARADGASIDLRARLKNFSLRIAALRRSESHTMRQPVIRGKVA